MAETDSDTSDISDLCVTIDIESEFDEAIEQITSLAQSYNESITKLQWLHAHSSISVNGTDLDAILDELHAESLKEIDETGQSSFGRRLIEKLISTSMN